MKFSVFTDLPEDFNPSIEVAGCYCCFQKKLLFFKETSRKISRQYVGSAWG